MTRSVRPLLRLALSLVALVGCVGSSDGDCPVTAPRGTVSLEVYQTPGWNGLDVVPTFQRQPDARDAIQCTRTTIGPCEVATCTRVGVDFVDGEPTCSGAPPGTLTVTRTGASPLRTDTSARWTLDRPLVEGESLAVRTDGGVVPAFSAAITLPHRAQVTGPAGLLDGRGLRLGPTDDLTVTWTPGPSQVRVVLRAANDQHTATCVFDGAAGRGTIPQAARSPDDTSVAVWSQEEIRLRAGAYPVTVRAVWATGAQALLTQSP